MRFSSRAGPGGRSSGANCHITKASASPAGRPAPVKSGPESAEPHSERPRRHTARSTPDREEPAVEITNLVVARYLDGRLMKGVTRDFSPNRPIFHVDLQDGASAVELRFRQLKALFFVKALDGDPARQDVRGFVHGPAETQQGKKIAVRFRDGEFVCGYTLSWSPDREGFFMFPADANSNNQRIFVITGSTLEIKAAPAAEVLAQRVLAEAPAPGDVPFIPADPNRSRANPMPPLGGYRPSGFLPRPPRPRPPPDARAVPFLPADPTRSRANPMPPLGGYRPSGFLPRPPRPGPPEERTGSD